MDVHPTKNGINRYWSIPIFPHFLCPKDPQKPPFQVPRRQQRTEANEPEARQVVQLRLLKLRNEACNGIPGLVNIEKAMKMAHL